MTIPIRERNSFIELNARERAQSVIDQGTFRELLGPFEKMASPIWRLKASFRRAMMALS